MPESASAYPGALVDDGVRIAALRPVLLSAPYADPENLEVRVALPTGWRTTGLVEVTLDDGTTGLGEGYLAVFAPQVFVSTVELLAPYLVGRPAGDLAGRYRDMVDITGYWSLQGAARHVVSAVEAALVDALGKRAGVLGVRAAGRPSYGPDPALRQRGRLDLPGSDEGRDRRCRRSRDRHLQDQGTGPRGGQGGVDA